MSSSVYVRKFLRRSPLDFRTSIDNDTIWDAFISLMRMITLGERTS